jgi:Fe-S cluster assembly protein SufD
MSAALRSFEAQFQQRPGDALDARRDAAMQRLLELGLPTLRDESWRYTNLRAVQAQRYAAAEPAGPAVTSPDPAAAAWLTDGGRIPAVVLVDGRLQDRPAALPAGLRIQSLRDVAARDPGRIERHFATPGDTDLRRWELLNTALFSDGLLIEVDGGEELALCVVHRSEAHAVNTAVHPRIIVELAANARATLIEHYLDAGTGSSLCNSCTQVSVGAGARLEHYRVFAAGAGALQFDSLALVQDPDSSCRLFTIALGGQLLRTALDARLAGNGAALESHALLVGSGERHVDCAAVVTHAAPATRSRQSARAIASGTSRVITNSKVIVAPGAMHADSQQSLRGMLLSPTAEIDTRPQLEIHTDEVRCAHGATTGRLDREMYFYLLSRGIDRDTAQSLLVFAFLGDVLAGMTQDAARAAIEASLITQLPDADRLKEFR